MKILVTVILLLLLSNLSAKSTIRIRGGAESGIYLQDSFSTQLLSTIYTSVNYRQQISDSQLDLKVRLSPRFYHPERFSNFRFVSNVDYRKDIGSNRLNLGLVFRKNWYDSNNQFSFSYRLWQISSKFIHSLSRKKRISIDLGIFSRDFSHNYFNRMRGYSGQLIYSFDLLNRLRMGAGINLEQFYISKAHSGLNVDSNSGRQIGPALSIGYHAKYIFTASIIYNWLTYEKYDGNHRNYHILLLLGRYLTAKTTVFFYANLYQGITNSNIPIELRYKPISDENTFYLKLGYDFRSNSELHIKIGYQQEELFNRNNSFSGVQVLLGLSFKL